MKRKAFGYLRVSTAKQAADDRTSLATQKAAIADHAARQGWELVSIRVEVKSGGKSIAQRPELAAAIADASEAKGVLVFYDLSRFARSMIDAMNVAEELKKHGAGMASCTEAIDTSDTSPSAELTFHVLAACAHFQRRLIGAKTREALKSRRKELGFTVQGVKPPGYRYDKETRELVEIPSEQRIIRRVLRLHAKHPDKSQAWLAARLNKMGVNTPQGVRKNRAMKWHQGTVRRILMAHSDRAGSA